MFPQWCNLRGVRMLNTLDIKKHPSSCSYTFSTSDFYLFHTVSDFCLQDKLFLYVLNIISEYTKMDYLNQHFEILKN